MEIWKAIVRNRRKFIYIYHEFITNIDDIYQRDFLTWNFPDIGKTTWAQRGSSSNYCNFEIRFTVIAVIVQRRFRQGETNRKLRAISNISLIKLRQMTSRIYRGNLLPFSYFLMNLSFYLIIMDQVTNHTLREKFF